MGGRRVRSYDVLARVATGFGIPRGWMGLAFDQVQREVILANSNAPVGLLQGERQQLTIRNREPAGMEVFVRLPFTAAPKA